MTTVLLAGCGAIGTQLGVQLQQAGYRVIGLRRSAVASPFPLLQADFTAPLDPALFNEPIHYVVHTATPGERSDAGYEKAYPGSVRNLLAALRGHPVRRFFFVSSTAVYAQDDGSWVDETSPTEPLEFNGVRMVEAERLLQESGVPATSVRFGGIYGPGRNWLVNRVKKGCSVQSQPPKYTNRIHQDDCVGVLQFLLQKNDSGVALDDCYVAVDDDPASEEAVCRWLAQQLGAPEPVLEIAAADAPQNKRCRNQRLRALGYVFTYPDFRSGYGARLA
ncbi:MAG: SDR family oxidoreductase [Pseudomonadota bacterium]